MPRFKVTLSIGYPTAEHEDEIEIEQSEWESCKNEHERQNLIDEYSMDWANNYIEVSATIIEE